MGDRVELPAADARKLRVVLRARTGDRVDLTDSGGRRFACSLVVEETTARLVLDREISSPAAPRLAITLAQALPKAAKMDYVVEKATELGVARIVPFVSSRVIGDGERVGKVERWRRLARAAAQQCGRHDVPIVDDPIAFDALAREIEAADVALIPWELAPSIPLVEVLPAMLEGVRTVLVVIGPEGGFGDDEIGRAEAAGARPISLGGRILRTETAGLVACTTILYAVGEL